MYVFFDLDHTLLRKTCGELYGWHLLKRGELSPLDLFRLSLWAIEHRLNILDIEDFLKKSTALIRGKREAWVMENSQICARELIPRYFYPKALAQIEVHRANGDKMFLLSAASEYIIEPIAKYLRFDGYLATKLVVKRGVLTGEIVPPFCYGEGKLEKLEAFCRRRKLDLNNCAYYGDSFSDRFVLEAVGTAYPANPDRCLKKMATERNWPVIDFR